MDTVGARLLKLLTDRGLSQSDLARKTGRSTAAISDVISGRRNMGLEFALEIATGLQMSPEEFFRRTGLMPEKSEDETVNKSKYLLDTLQDPANRQQALEYIEFLKLKEEKANYNAGQHRATQPRQSS